MNYNENNNWIKLSRKITENPYWLSAKFTPGQAMVDLLMLANWQETSFVKRMVKVTVDRGQVAWSKKALSVRWGWSITKVTGFLFTLENDGFLETKSTPLTTVITILNYDLYQDNRNQTEIKQKSSRNQKETYKERQESKEGKEQLTSCREDDKEKIYEEWNRRAKANTRMPIARSFSKGRKIKIALRLKDSNWHPAFTQALTKLPIANRPGFDWQPDIDWMIANDENVFKVLEGKYDTKASIANTPASQPALSKMESDILSCIDIELKLKSTAIETAVRSNYASGGSEHYILDAIDICKNMQKTKQIDNMQSLFLTAIKKVTSGEWSS
tara:strand:+ start:1053 stop:2039 length:987 start_codon:yes stop_codon:yes gene_type:complete